MSSKPIAAALLVFLTTACSDPEPNPNDHGGASTISSAISNGTAAAAGEGTWVVSLGACTGTLLSPYAVITAAHCVPEGGKVELVVRRGPDASECLPKSSGCSPVALKISRHWDVDLAILSSRVPLVPPSSQFPVVDLGGPIDGVEAWGYGDGSYKTAAGTVTVSHGSRLLHSSVPVSRLLYAEIEARTAGDTSVCGGDSGGPATFQLKGGVVLAGVMRASEASPADTRCTKPGGRQFWARPGAHVGFIESVMGSCERTSLDGRAVASCAGNGPRKAGPAPADPALDYLVGLPSVRRQALAGDRSSDIRLTAWTPNSGPTDVVLDGDVTTDGPTLVPAQDAMLVQDRGWSQNLDSRFQITGMQAPEVGRILSVFVDGSTAFGKACSGTLIGRRIVRTAAHCITRTKSDMTMQWPQTVTFELNRDGSSFTRQVQAGGVVIYTSWSSDPWWPCYKDDVGDPIYRNNPSQCTERDVAFLMLPANAWDGLGYTPAVMGYRAAQRSDQYVAGTHAGYPACLQDNSPAGCPEGSNPMNNFWKYATTDWDCFISVFGNPGANVWSSGCDTSAAMSGGPFYYPSGRILLGHATFQMCTTCAYNPSGTLGVDALTVDQYYTPNYFVGLTPADVTLQNNLNSWYP